MIGAAAFLGLSFVGYWMYGVYLHAPPTSPSPSPTPAHSNPHPATSNGANAGADVGHMGELEDYDGDGLPVSGVTCVTCDTEVCHCVLPHSHLPRISLPRFHPSRCATDTYSLKHALSLSHIPSHPTPCVSYLNRSGRRKGWTDRLHRRRQGGLGSGK